MTTRPPNCRIFLGNLPSERTSREELNEIFSKYGNIVEEIVLRRSFGFIQYDNPESAMAAIRGENGRIIGGMRVDINLADNREPKKRNDKEKDNRRDKRRSPSPPSSRRRTRDDYEYRESGQENDTEDRRKRQYGTVPQYMSPAMQPTCQVIYLGQPEKDYAYRVGQLLSQQITTLRVDYMVTERRNLPQAIDKAKQRSRYIVVVGKFHQSRQTVDLHIIRQLQPEELPYLEAVEKIRTEEQRMNMFAPLPMGNNVSTGAYAYVNPAFLQQFQAPNLQQQQQQQQQQQLLQLLQQTQMQQNSNTLNQLVGGSGLLPTPFPSIGALNLPNNQNSINQPSVSGNLGNPNLQYQTSTSSNPSDLFSTLLNNSQILQSLNSLSNSQGVNPDSSSKSSRNISLPNSTSNVSPANNSLSSFYNMMASTSNQQLETSNPTLNLNANLARLTSPDSTAVNLNGNVGPRPSPSPSNVNNGSGNANPGLLGSQNNEMLASLLSKLSGANIPGGANLNANFTQSISSQGPNNPNYGVLGSPSPQATESHNQGSEEYSPYAPSIMGNPPTNPLGAILSRKS